VDEVAAMDNASKRMLTRSTDARLDDLGRTGLQAAPAFKARVNDSTLELSPVRSPLRHAEEGTADPALKATQAELPSP
jgi:hypothetical protein